MSSRTPLIVFVALLLMVLPYVVVWIAQTGGLRL